jgi:acyl CoA:acetate/3-ketoacid CoA transferase alpha subunit
VKRVINKIDTAGATDLYLARVVQPVTQAVLRAVVTTNGIRAMFFSLPRFSQTALSKEVRLSLVMTPEVTGDEMERLENTARAIPEVYGVAWMGWQ